MSEIFPAYRLAEHIHSSFYQYNDLLTREEIEESGVRGRPSHIFQTPQLTASAESEGQRFSQQLSLAKNGIYYFSTVYSGEGGAVIINHITPNSPLERLEDLTGSVFMRALLKIAYERTSTSGFGDFNSVWIHRNSQSPKLHPIASRLEI